MLEILEGAGCKPEGHGRACCLPRNAEAEPASPTGTAEAETAAAAAEAAARAAEWAAHRAYLRHERVILKIAKERGLSFEDAAESWYGEIDRFADERGLVEFEDAIDVWLKEQEEIDDCGKE